MPTGYTSDLYDGKPQTFPEFVLSCARNFGALIIMRDEPPDAVIPDKFEAGSYHSKALTEAKEERDWLLHASEAECAAKAEEEADEWDARQYAAEVRRIEIKARYEAMLAEAEAWTPPTSEHRGLKDFMVQQLTKSIKFDCSTYDFENPPRDGEEWRAMKLSKADWNINYHATEFAKEVERAAQRSAWVQALRQSLTAQPVKARRHEH